MKDVENADSQVHTETTETDEDRDNRISTASDNVTVLDPDFFMSTLNRDRTIRLYLPPGYEEHPTEHYPVLYMHDGQNLFDEATSYVGEWSVDKSLNTLAQEKDLKLMVVGIDNGKEHRLNELSAWDHQTYGKGDGKRYLDFIVEQLMPYINKHYRTKTDRLNTGIMGSSMGGLMSHYAIHHYPQHFAKAGIFSPSYWYANEVFAHANDNTVLPDSKLYFLMGGEEDLEMRQDMDKMVAQIIENGHQETLIKSKTVAKRGHHESFWAEEFAEAVTWLFDE